MTTFSYMRLARGGLITSGILAQQRLHCVGEDTIPAELRRNFVTNEYRRDGLIAWMKSQLNHSFVLNFPESYASTFSAFEKLVRDHRADPEKSRLRELVPSVGVFHTDLPILAAWQKYNEKYAVTSRRHVTPSFNEIRHTLNLSQVMAVAPNLKMMSFDGDQTLYSDGGNFSDPHIAASLSLLLRSGVKVVVVTAAGYGTAGEKYEHRLQGFLTHLEGEDLSEEEINQFIVMGGECNYLLKSTRCPCGKVRLVPVPDQEWNSVDQMEISPRFWDPLDVAHVLNVAEASLRSSKEDLHLRARIIRKERGVGLVPGGEQALLEYPTGHGSKRMKQEALNEVVLRVQEDLSKASVRLKYCAFNGGTDAWVDVGDKSVGVQAAQAYFQLKPEECLHVGDQFLSNGNDFAARGVSPCLWIQKPRETQKVLEVVLGLMGVEQAKVSLPGSKMPGSSPPQVDVYTGEGLGLKVK